VTISTGIISMIPLGSTLHIRTMPLAEPIDNPSGPPKLSIQPGKGSLNVVNTVNKRTRETEKIIDL
jgi:hypothetical protein